MSKSGVLVQKLPRLIWGMTRPNIKETVKLIVECPQNYPTNTPTIGFFFAQKMMMGAISKHLSGDFRKTFWFFSAATAAATLGEFFKDVNNRLGDASVSCLIDTTRFRWRFIHDRFSMKFHVNDNEKEEENRVRQRWMNGSSPYRHSIVERAAAPRRSAEMFAQFISCLIMLIDGTFDGVSMKVRCESSSRC